MKIKNTLPRSYTVAGVTLNPGTNTVDEKFEEAFMGHPHVKAKLKKGVLELVEGNAPSEDEQGSGKIDFDTAKAEDIVDWVRHATDEDFDRLNTLTEHKFATVKKAAKEKLEELTQE